MNTPVRRIALAVMGMIVLLMANLTYVQVVKASDYRTDSRNQRVLLAEYSRQRGQISAAGQVLANSVETGDRLRYQREYPDGPEYDSFAWQVLTTLATKASASTDDHRLTITLSMRSAIQEPDPDMTG